VKYEKVNYQNGKSCWWRKAKCTCSERTTCLKGYKPSYEIQIESLRNCHLSKQKKKKKKKPQKIIIKKTTPKKKIKKKKKKKKKNLNKKKKKKKKKKKNPEKFLSFSCLMCHVIKLHTRVFVLYFPPKLNTNRVFHRKVLTLNIVDKT